MQQTDVRLVGMWGSSVNCMVVLSVQALYLQFYPSREGHLCTSAQQLAHHGLQQWQPCAAAAGLIRADLWR